ncbi:MAG: PIG-L deacetylase family protein [Planctomycetaceae bacterium]
MEAPAALAVVAHPDDIEFYCAGTLLRLREAGWAIHYHCVADGDCGSLTTDRDTTRAIRAAEAQAAAAILGATHHESLTSDLLVFYDERLLRKLVTVVRRARPRIVLTHAPADYMEDHMNTARLAVTATFAKGFPNFVSDPPVAPVPGDVAVYHAMPHGLQDGLRRPVQPDCFVDVTAVRETKRRALAAHVSQKAWLDQTQGMDSYLDAADAMSREVGRMSGCFEHAEGWRRHLHLGFSARDDDPLAEALGASCIPAPA